MEKIKPTITTAAVLILLSGCIERGYRVTVQQRAHTTTATQSINLNTETKEVKETLHKMERSIKAIMKSQDQTKQESKKVKKVKVIKAVKTSQKQKDLVSKIKREEVSHQKVNVSKKTPPETAQKKSIPTKKKNIKRDNKTYVQYSSPLHFIAPDQTYQKYGTSEIHGHVIYLSSTNDEIMLPDTKIYLVPSSKVLDSLYKNFYLKNQDIGSKKIKARYLKKTDLDLSKNFSFFGVPEGEYYLIIESPAPDDTEKKIYMAKKIDVGKYKKVMAVFSKRL